VAVAVTPEARQVALQAPWPSPGVLPATESSRAWGVALPLMVAPCLELKGLAVATACRVGLGASGVGVAVLGVAVAASGEGLAAVGVGLAASGEAVGTVAGPIGSEAVTTCNCRYSQFGPPASQQLLIGGQSRQKLFKTL